MLNYSPSQETLRFMERQEKLNKEILDKIDLLSDIVIEIRTDVKNIHEQTKKTNGRVTKNETWRNRMIGGLIVTEALLLPIAIKFIYELLA